MPWDTYAQRRIRAPVSDIRAAKKIIVAANNAILRFFLWSSSEYLEKIVKRWCEDMRKFGESNRCKWLTDAKLNKVGVVLAFLLLCACTMEVEQVHSNTTKI